MIRGRGRERAAGTRLGFGLGLMGLRVFWALVKTRTACLVFSGGDNASGHFCGKLRL